MKDSRNQKMAGYLACDVCGGPGGGVAYDPGPRTWRATVDGVPVQIVTYVASNGWWGYRVEGPARRTSGGHGTYGSAARAAAFALARLRRDPCRKGLRAIESAERELLATNPEHAALEALDASSDSASDDESRGDHG